MKNVALTLRVDHARERRDAIDQAWYPLLSRCGFRPFLLPNAPTDPSTMTAYLQDFDIQGVIMTGGNDLREAPEPMNLAPERDNLETLLLDACATQNIPVLGICRGLQKIVVRYGGTLKHVDGHVGTSHPIEVKPEAPAAFQTREQVNSFHGFGVHVDDLGKELRPAVIAPDGTVEALFHVRHRQWGIMWHPEREPKDPRDQQILRLLIDGE